jgi:integrase
MCRSVLSGMCALAARHDALPHNPVKDLGRLNGRPKTAPRALTLPELRQLRAALTYDEKAIARDLPDLVALLMATGLRIGEACGLTWNAIDLEIGLVEVRGRRRPGARRRAGDQIDQDRRRPPHPDPPPLVHRHAAGSSPPAAGDGCRQWSPARVSPTAWRLARPVQHPSDLRDAFTAAGFDWVTTHVFRRTVATLMDQAGLSSRTAADQLGHANASMTTDVYFGRKIAATGAAAVLETLRTLPDRDPSAGGAS